MSRVHTVVHASTSIGKAMKEMFGVSCALNSHGPKKNAHYADTTPNKWFFDHWRGRIS